MCMHVCTCVLHVYESISMYIACIVCICIHVYTCMLYVYVLISIHMCLYFM